MDRLATPAPSWLPLRPPITRVPVLLPPLRLVMARRRFWPATGESSTRPPPLVTLKFATVSVTAEAALPERERRPPWTARIPSTLRPRRLLTAVAPLASESTPAVFKLKVEREAAPVTT